jgi:hypothetical protein
MNISQKFFRHWTRPHPVITILVRATYKIKSRVEFWELFLCLSSQWEMPSFTAIQNITALPKFCNLQTATTRPGHLNLISRNETELLVFFSHKQVTYIKSKFGLFYGWTRVIEINRACPKRFISPTPTTIPWQNGGYNRQHHSHCIIYFVARICRRIN